VDSNHARREIVGDRPCAHAKLCTAQLRYQNAPPNWGTTTLKIGTNSTPLESRSKNKQLITTRARRKYWHARNHRLRFSDDVPECELLSNPPPVSALERLTILGSCGAAPSPAPVHMIETRHHFKSARENSVAQRVRKGMQTDLSSTETSRASHPINGATSDETDGSAELNRRTQV
jgi:hypothetical protein